MKFNKLFIWIIVFISLISIVNANTALNDTGDVALNKATPSNGQYLVAQGGWTEFYCVYDVGCEGTYTNTQKVNGTLGIYAYYIANKGTHVGAYNSTMDITNGSTQVFYMKLTDTTPNTYDWYGVGACKDSSPTDNSWCSLNLFGSGYDCGYTPTKFTIVSRVTGANICYQSNLLFDTDWHKFLIYRNLTDVLVYENNFDNLILNYTEPSGFNEHYLRSIGLSVYGHSLNADHGEFYLDNVYLCEGKNDCSFLTPSPVTNNFNITITNLTTNQTSTYPQINDTLRFIANIDLPNKILIHYSFDDGVWLNDTSGNGYNAYNNGAVNTTGIIGQGIFFNNTEDTEKFIKINGTGENINFNKFSISGWIKSDSSTTDYPSKNIISFTNDFSNEFYIKQDQTAPNLYTFATGNDTNFFTVGNVYVTDATEFNYFVYVNNGTHAIRYLNGEYYSKSYEFESHNQYLDFTINNTNPLTIGAKPDGTLNWAGTIDDFRLYDFALTPEEILTLYNSGLGTQDNFIKNVTNNTEISCNLFINNTNIWTLSDTTNFYTSTYLYKNINDKINFNYVIPTTMTVNNSNITYYINCTNPAGTVFQSNLSNFAVKDITYPYIRTNPIGNNILYNNQSVISNLLYNLTINYSFFDYNLFAVEINITCEKYGNIFYYSIENLNVTQYDYNATINISNLSLQKCLIKRKGTDDHTDEEWKADKITKKNNGLEIIGNTVSSQIISLDDDYKNIKTKEKLDRVSFNFEYKDKKLERKFIVKNPYNNIYYRENSGYNAHFVDWNPSTQNGNWIDFEEIDKNNYITNVKKLENNDYEVTITKKKPNDKDIIVPEKKWYELKQKTKEEYILDTYGIDSLSFNSIGGVLITEDVTEFYIGGVINVTSVNIYDNGSINNYTVTVQSINTTPIFTTTYSTNGNSVLLTSITNGTHLITYTHNTSKFFTQYLNYNVNTTKMTYLNYSSYQGIVTLNGIDVYTDENIDMLNFSANNLYSTRIDNITDVEYATFYLNSTNYTFYGSGDIYFLTNETRYVNYLDNISISLRMPFTSNFTLYDEKTLELFNMSSPNTITFQLYCPDKTTNTILTDVSTILPIDCKYDKFKFILDYDDTSYYRTYILPPSDILNVGVYLADVRTTQLLYNSFVIDDLLKQYINPSIYIKKNIEGTYYTITSDYVDLQKSIGAYLIQNNEYIIEINADNSDVINMGGYFANSAGTIVLRLYDVGVGSNPYGINHDVTLDIGYINNDSYSVVSSYTDISNTTTSVEWCLYNNTYPGTALYCSVSNSSSVTFTYPYTGLENSTLYGTLEFNYNSENKLVGGIIQAGITITEEINKIKSYVDKETLNWIILIFLSTIVLSFTIRTASIGAIVICALGLMFSYFRLWYISVPILTVGIVIALAAFMKEKSNEVQRQ